jgi:hypothetical protein
MSETLTQEHTDVMQRIQDINAEMRKAEIEHAFNWWWCKEGSAPAALANDVYGYAENRSRAAFHEACRVFGLDSKPVRLEPQRKPPINLLYSLFALGVVVGVFLTFALGLIIIQPK